MKKIYLIAIILLCIITTFCGCNTIVGTTTTSSSISDYYTSENIEPSTNIPNQTTDNEKFNGIEKIYVESLSVTTQATCFRDKNTDVMYLWVEGASNGGLSVMLDPETGAPLTYTRYLELQKTEIPKIEDVQ